MHDRQLLQASFVYGITGYPVKGGNLPGTGAGVFIHIP
jgi:hypothetical protein